MTRVTFLARLAQTPRTWRVSRCHAIVNADIQCPICAVEGSGRWFANWEAAATMLDLAHPLAQDIMFAADNHGKADPELRQQLLVATGLAPQPEP